ncbi:MAG: hypothetical protein LBR77_02225 [Lachnospiraceae bacterium]|jgi:beta-mannosidase|nr:hypothetical protein [Lachnospiraceae bacterium]
MRFSLEWQVSRAGEDDFIPATVPGSVHYDLMAAGRLENPFASSKNAFGALWVQQSDWLFRARFSRGQVAIDADEFVLRFCGVDTLSEIRLNGSLLGETRNAYKVYEFILRKSDLQDENELTVLVMAHGKLVEGKESYAKRLQVGDAPEGLFGKAMIRRYQRSFFCGSSLLNLGTGVLGIGIYRDVEIDYNIVKDWKFTVLGLDWGGSRAHCGLEAKTTGGPAHFTLRDGAVVVYEGPAGDFDIENPKLWWPNGYGDAHLYSLSVQAGQHRIDAKVGVKKVELVERTDGKDDFHFRINGRKVYIHGQNHIPLDYIKAYRGEHDYDNHFALLKNQHVNLVRIWGGGVVENPSFYDRLDENGILLWHDLFLHSNVYPDFDEGWVGDYAQEVAGVIDQVKNRASLALICGGNEQYEGWDEWGWKNHMEYFFGERLVTEVAPAIAREKCPEIPYIVNSPHGGKTCQSPASGESHIWGSYYNSFKDPLFVTETCWTQESYSRPETLRKYMDLDVADYTQPGWAKRWEERTGRPFFNRMPFTNWFAPETLASYLHGLELEQMRADYHALSNFRYNSPSNNGVIYWAMNKGGPLFQFSCVDYGGVPMMPYYAVKKVFAPIGVFPYRDQGDVFVMASNHTKDSADVTVRAYLYDGGGKLAQGWSRDVALSPGEVRRALWLEGVHGGVKERVRQSLYVTVSQGGRVLCDDLLLFAPFGEYEIADNSLDIVCQKTDNGYKLDIGAHAPIHMVEIECNKKALYSDNYFPLTQDGAKEILATVLDDDGCETVFAVNALGWPAQEVRAG